MSGAKVRIQSPFAGSPKQARQKPSILTDSVNIAPDPQKIPSYSQVGSSGTTPCENSIKSGYQQELHTHVYTCEEHID